MIQTDVDYLVDEFRVELTSERSGSIYVTVGGEERWAKDIAFPKGIKSNELHDLAWKVLYKMGFRYKENPNKKKTAKNDTLVDYPKAIDTNKVFLAPATNKPKVILKPHTREYKEIVVYALKIKGTNKFISAIDDKGYRVTTKGTPLFFTSDDIAAIGNLEDFEVIKMTRKCKSIANKIAK